MMNFIFKNGDETGLAQLRMVLGPLNQSPLGLADSAESWGHFCGRLVVLVKEMGIGRDSGFMRQTHEVGLHGTDQKYCTLWAFGTMPAP